MCVCIVYLVNLCWKLLSVNEWEDWFLSLGNKYFPIAWQHKIEDLINSSDELIVAWWKHQISLDWGNDAPINEFLADGSKPSPEQMLIYCQMDPNDKKFIEILIKIPKFPLRKIYLEIVSVKLWHLYLNLFSIALCV